MTYSSYEESLDLGTPIELYEFTQGLKRWTFVSAADPVMFDSREYSPVPIKRNRIKQTMDTFQDDLKLDFPRGDEFAGQFLGFAPEIITTVTIRRGHYGDPDSEFIVYWKGRVMGGKASGNTISIECESVFTSIKRPGLRARYEYTCRHTLYSRGCGVNIEAYKHEGNVNAVDGNDVFVDGATAYGDGYFTGGMLKSGDGTLRFITAHTGDALTLSRPIPGAIGETLVSIYPGCDHLKSTCINKFNNLDNFGGFPYIPGRNPFDGNSIV